MTDRPDPKRANGDALSVAFRERLRGGTPLLGTFLKTPSVHASEILADLGFDFLIVDQEHAPFDQHALDCLALAMRAGNCPTLVRVPDADPSRLLAILDLGFSGVMIPHVSSAAIARDAARACRYVGGGRGFSNSPRAGLYGRHGLRDHVARADAAVSVVVMIEDADAVAAIDEILRVDGIDAVMIGRADLAVAMNQESVDAPPVVDAVEKILNACRAHRRSAILHVAKVDEIGPFLGSALVYVVSSDQGMLRRAGAVIRNEFTQRTATL